MSPRTRLTLQIIAGLLTVAFLTAVGLGLDRLLDFMSFDFTLGALSMLCLVLVVYFASQWLDKSAANAARPGEHQRPRHTIDL